VIVLGWVLGGLLLAGAALLPGRLAASRRRTLAAARASAEAAYQRLGFAVETATAGSGALARARERWHTAGALLADASSAEQCAVAERCAREGLAALS